MAALFTTSERPEELPARTAKPRPVRKSRVAGNLVLEPFKDVEEYKIDDLFSKQIYEDGKHSVPYLLSLWKASFLISIWSLNKTWKTQQLLFQEIGKLMLKL